MAEARKADHIELAFQSQIHSGELDSRFLYEPLFSAHPEHGSLPAISFLQKTLRTPIWVSSMTGGAEWAQVINTRLAKACHQFGMGMGLGSCRSLLTSDEHLADFAVRPLIGPDLPLYANLGIAQLESLIDGGDVHLIESMLTRLDADGLIIHVNPLQEWFQPEGDQFRQPPLRTIRRILDQATYPLIVKEVGQGMGYHSLKALLQLPLAAVDLAAAGGTNFARLENLRRTDHLQEHWAPMVHVGHHAEEMVEWIRHIQQEKKGELACQQIIISGGIRHFLDGYYLTERCPMPAIYGQASVLLKVAQQGEEALQNYLEAQIRGLEMAHAYLRIRKEAGI
ncbi:MAG: isopentenyl-diphosphate delta-isomerase [Saprospiraceae bacterium]|nr:isopentenyl-diphosphate delta-isomerase [Saprospiraceae bacterium]